MLGKMRQRQTTLADAQIFCLQWWTSQISQWFASVCSTKTFKGNKKKKKWISAFLFTAEACREIFYWNRPFIHISPYVFSHTAVTQTMAITGSSSNQLLRSRLCVYSYCSCAKTGSEWKATVSIRCEKQVFKGSKVSFDGCPPLTNQLWLTKYISRVFSFIYKHISSSFGQRKGSFGFPFKKKCIS